jgi:hypothetical protein
MRLPHSQKRRESQAHCVKQGQEQRRTETQLVAKRCRRDETKDNPMRAFIRRFLMHYGIYRRYPLGRLPSLRNAWRNARA